MRELRPGLFHWTTFHDGIGAPVSSYYVEPADAVIDGRVPDEGLEAAFDGRAAPSRRSSPPACGCAVRAPSEARDRLGPEPDFEPFNGGDEVAPGISAIHVGELCPDEYALHIAHGPGAISFADALMRYGE